MFNNFATQPSLKPLRNPRRRPRASSEDVMKLPKAKRARSTLRQNNELRINTNPDEAAEELNVESVVPTASPKPVAFSNLALRGPRKAERTFDNATESSLLVSLSLPSIVRCDQPLDSDGEIIIVKQRPLYRVSFVITSRSCRKRYIRYHECIIHTFVLFSLISSGPIRYGIFPDYGYSFALSHKEAVIWPCDGSSLHVPNRVIRFSLPCPSPSSVDVPPLGTFISKSVEDSPGLLVIVPSTGSIVMWESLSNAAILGFVKQRQNGTQGQLSGLFFGEVPVDIVNAEPAGIIVTLSTGRFAHISIRDPQGKPTISVQIFRGMTATGGLGLLDGIKNVLSGHLWTSKVAAVRSGVSYQRGQREIVLASHSGIFEWWDMHWSNGGSLRSRVDIKQCLLRALLAPEAFDEHELSHAFQVCDFVVDTKNASRSEIHTSPEQQSGLWVLISLSREASIRHFVVKLHVNDCSVHTRSAYRVQTGNSTFEELSACSPRLLVSTQDNLAYIMFSRFVVLMLLKSVSNTSNDPLFSGDNHSKAKFQDIVQFQTGNGYQITECGIEAPRVGNQSSSCIFPVRNYGMIRIAALKSLVTGDIEQPRISLKSRVEQVVYYGKIKSNPLNFMVPDAISSSAELRKASLEINEEILNSSSKYLPKVPSLDQQMKIRAAALHDLIVYLQQCRADLPNHVRWQLLWGAEKLAAQRCIWDIQQQSKVRALGHQTHLERIISQMNEKFRTKPSPKNAENDEVRLWFMCDTSQVENIIPWISNGMREICKTSKADRESAARLWEASELSLATLETAFHFRDDNISLYGLDNALAEPVVHYHGLPECWTSQVVTCQETEQLLDSELKFCLRTMRHVQPEEDANANAIKRNIPRQFRVLVRMHDERSQWCISQQDQFISDSGKLGREFHAKRGKVQLFKMASVGLLHEAILLAENFRDMDALVELMRELYDQIKPKGNTNSAENSEVSMNDQMRSWKRRIDKYFVRFGDAWASAFFNAQISAGQPVALLAMPEYQKPLTEFFRSRPGYSKLSWMNDIIGENDYKAASKTLEDLAVRHESDLWSRLVELSLGKLALLADFENSGFDDVGTIYPAVKAFNDLSEISTIQEILYSHFLPVLHGAIDQQAEVQLAMEQFANKLVNNKPILYDILRRGISKLVSRSPLEANEIIDILTLMDPVQVLEENDTSGVIGHEFTMSLRVLRLYGSLHPNTDYYKYLQRTIWRRCILKNDWIAINNTRLKGDLEIEKEIVSTALFQTVAEYFKGKLNLFV